MLRQFWRWLVAQIIQPDPWESPCSLRPGQLLLRENVGDPGEFRPARRLAVVDSVAEAYSVAAGLGVKRWFVTNARDDSADEHDAWRLTALEVAEASTYRLPEMSPAEVEVVLRGKIKMA